MPTDQVTREQVLALLDGRNAHMNFDDAVADFPLDQINTRPPNVPYSPWHLVEHLRIAQWDILEFIRNPDHRSPPWPEGYWPPQDEDASPAQWQATLQTFRSDLKALKELAMDTDVDLYAPMPLGEKYNVLRELLLVADHNAYHIGEFAILRQVMGTWRSR